MVFGYCRWSRSLFRCVTTTSRLIFKSVISKRAIISIAGVESSSVWLSMVSATYAKNDDAAVAPEQAFGVPKLLAPP